MFAERQMMQASRTERLKRRVRKETPLLPSCFKCSAVMSFGPAAGELLVRRIASTVSIELKGMKFLSSGLSVLTLRNDSLMFLDVLNGTALAYCLQNSDAINGIACVGDCC